MLLNIPSLPGILYDQLGEYLAEEDPERRAELMGRAVTEGLLLVLPSPKQALVNKLNGVSKKLGKAAIEVAAVSSKSLIKSAKLPHTGKIRFIPRPTDLKSGKILQKNGGFVDKFGNVWKKGPTRTKGQAFEWDIQLSKTGKNKLGHLSPDSDHLNVSLDGKITH